jgi:polyisoprenoid-binding protein YceI
MVRYDIDHGHTHVGFTAKHLAVSTVHGEFAKFDGYFEGPDGDFTKARGKVTVDVKSLNTRNDQRDTHLRSADFFDVEKYPTMTFEVTGIEQLEGESYLVRGNLTIKDVTRPIALDATIEGRVPDPFGAIERLGISASGQLNRMDFGLNWDGVAGAVPFASHTIKLDLDGEIVVKAAETAAA